MHDLNVPRDLVYAVMYNVDPDALAERAPQYKKTAKGNFVSRGPNWVHSLDGHDKLMDSNSSGFTDYTSIVIHKTFFQYITIHGHQKMVDHGVMKKAPPPSPPSPLGNYR